VNTKNWQDLIKPMKLDVSAGRDRRRSATLVAEPLERGFGMTLGNSLRRVLLSSLQGAAVTSVHIDGVLHEFSSIAGVREDVTDIVLNIKDIAIKMQGEGPKRMVVKKQGPGTVTAGDIQTDGTVEVLNPDHHIATLDAEGKLSMELEIRIGRGYCPAEWNKADEPEIGVIPIDSLFSPVTRVKYGVDSTRVGQMTDYDKLVLDIWTDGRVTPQDALLQASSILRHHLDVFVDYDDNQIEFEDKPEAQSEEHTELKKLLNMSVNEIELSVRAANCLNNANITSVGQLAMKSEAEMLKYRNFGKKSLNEIKDKLSELGLGLGMTFDPSLLSGPIPSVQAPRLGMEEEAPVGVADLIAQNIDE